MLWGGKSLNENFAILFDYVALCDIKAAVASSLSAKIMKVDCRRLLSWIERRDVDIEC